MPIEIDEVEHEDEVWMREALFEANRAAERGEVPVGSVMVLKGQIVGRGHNLRECAQDPTAHAELIAMRAAAARLGTWRLTGVTAYVTLEPCPMCAGAFVNSRIERVVYGARDPKAGATETLFRLGDDGRLNHQFESVGGVLEVECAKLLSDFFKAIRVKRKKQQR